MVQSLAIMDWLKDNWFKLAIVGVLLLITYPVYYHYVIYNPQKDQKARDAERTKQIEEQEARESIVVARNICLAEAEMSYSIDWDNACKEDGANHKNKNCRLPGTIAERLEKRLNARKEG